MKFRYILCYCDYNHEYYKYYNMKNNKNNKNVIVKIFKIDENNNIYTMWYKDKEKYKKAIWSINPDASSGLTEKSIYSFKILEGYYDYVKEITEAEAFAELL